MCRRFAIWPHSQQTPFSHLHALLTTTAAEHQFIAICCRWHLENQQTTSVTILEGLYSRLKSAPHCFKVFSPTTKIKSLPVQLECSSLSRPVPQFRIHCRLAIYGPLPHCRGPHLNSLPLPLTSFSQPHPFCSCPKTHKRSEYLPTKIFDFLQSLRQH